MEGFDFRSAERKWQKRWEEAKLFVSKEDPKKKKCYVLEMFPYPSAAGLHMGHIRNYAMGDAFARFRRMQGHNVLYPMGYDAFGLPAENAAIKSKTHPKEYTEKAIAGIKRNQKALGLSYDWTREIATCYPEYYRWNQWFFLRMLEKGLAYKKEAPVNWCPKCETVLANEQVEDGRCWRCESEVTEKSIEQWFFRITSYADELLEGLDKLAGWPERIKAMQRNWIGKSHGVDMQFRLEVCNKILPEALRTFTTRCDTIYSVTFLAIAPEHPMIGELVRGTGRESEVDEFVHRMKKQSMADRTNEEKEKEGVFTGRHAINPVNGERIPIYVANFAVMYGSGIVMCDAHDKRDFRFARKYGIPLKFVISRDGKPIDPEDYDDAFTDDGILFDSGQFSGMGNVEALPKMADWLEKKGFGKKAINYKIRDWGISRQRYWGTPIPVVYCGKCGMVPVPEKDLPVLLPEDVEFTGHGNPLEKDEKFVSARCPKCGGKARRETDTMDTFVDSSWYFLRYCSPKSSGSAFDQKAVRYWMPVDQYIGGAEHAVMHLLYARFFTKALRDMGLVGFSEPFTRLFNQGIVYKDGHKMSKSFGNAVTQEEMSERYGIDTARLFLLSVASPDSQLEWSDEGIQGAFRFVNKVMRLAEESAPIKPSGRGPAGGIRDRMLAARTAAAIDAVTRQIEGFQFNLAISCIMDLANRINEYAGSGSADDAILGSSMKAMVQLLSPFAPHLAEEIWEMMGMKGFVSVSPWPEPGHLDEEAEAMEAAASRLTEDISSVIKLAGIKPAHIRLIQAPAWKYRLMGLLREEVPKSRDLGSIMKKASGIEELRPHGQEISRIAGSALRNPERVSGGFLGMDVEAKLLEGLRPEIEKTLGCRVTIEGAEGSQSKKSSQALPGKPGIEVS